MAEFIKVKISKTQTKDSTLEATKWPINVLLFV